MYLPAVLLREPRGRDGEGEQEDEVDGDGAEEAVGEVYCTVLYCTVLYCTALYCTP